MQFDQLKRREFITLIGGAAAAWPLAARAQQPGKLPTVGVLGATSASAWSRWIAAFVQRLRELGWIEGRNLRVEYRWAEGSSERAAELAAEFVRLNVDVIVTGGLPAVAAKQATSVIPIVFAIAADPLGTGLGRESGAAGRQYHRRVDPGWRSCWQTSGTLARGCPWAAPVGGLGKYQLRRLRDRNEPGSGSRPHAWPRSRRP